MLKEDNWVEENFKEDNDMEIILFKFKKTLDNLLEKEKTCNRERVFFINDIPILDYTSRI